MGLAFNDFEKINTELTTLNTVLLTKVVSSEIKIKKSSKGAEWIDLDLKGYPNFYFKIQGCAYKSMNTKSFLNSVSVGDTLHVTIETETFKKKISKELPLSLTEKIFSRSSIPICGLSDEKMTYLLLKDYNLAENAERKVGFGFNLILGIVFLVIGFKIKPKDN